MNTNIDDQSYEYIIRQIKCDHFEVIFLPETLILWVWKFHHSNLGKTIHHLTPKTWVFLYFTQIMIFFKVYPCSLINVYFTKMFTGNEVE